jgi:hypothetical protein
MLSTQSRDYRIKEGIINLKFSFRKYQLLNRSFFKLIEWKIILSHEWTGRGFLNIYELTVFNVNWSVF